MTWPLWLSIGMGVAAIALSVVAIVLDLKARRNLRAIEELWAARGGED